MANWSENAVTVLNARYLLKDKTGKVIESPDGMLARVVKFVASKEKDKELWEKKFLEIMDTLEFLPNSPTLMNAGKPNAQLSACFLLDISDDLANIFEQVKQSALIAKSGGGCGLLFSNIRPAGSLVNTTSGVSSGPVSFMHCISGETKIASPCGEFLIKDLVGKEIPVYSWSGKEVVISIMRDIRKTQINAKVYKIVLDNGESLIATSDHQVMMRGGLYKKVEELKKGNSLMPFGKKTKSEIYIALNNGKTITEPLIVSEWKYGRKKRKDESVHHIDGNHLNNSPENLEFLSRSEHSKKFKGTKPRYDQFVEYPPDMGERVSKGLLANTTFEQRSKNSKRARTFSSGMTGKHQTEHCKQVTSSLRKGKTFVEQYGEEKAGEISKSISEAISGEKNGFYGKHHSEETKRIIKEKRALQIIPKQKKEKEDRICEVCNETFTVDSKKSKRKHCSDACKKGFTYNHKVVSIEEWGFCDVYNGEVDDYHNFAISAGVFIHNCFDTASGAVKQGGVRRGANIGILTISHPDIIDFVTCKEDINNFQNFNISVTVTDNFIKAVYADSKFPLKNPKTKEITYINAKKLFDIIVHQAWLTGEPGMLFIDTINAKNPTPWLGSLSGTNPCGEQPLLPCESCNLGSIDISKFVKGRTIDWNRLSDVVETAVRFLDDIIEVNSFPNVKIERKTKQTRKVGLGIMGFADALILLGHRYGDEKSLKLAKRIMMNIRETAHMTSRDLGKEKGFCQPKLKRRNACLTTIAPTGSISMIADCSSGIEPLFAKNFTKRVMGNIDLKMGKKYKDIDENDIVIASEIPFEKHIEMQAALQEYTDNAVSKTVNLANTATEDDIRKAFLLAHFLGCKGITVYRDGSRDAPLKKVEQGLSECESGKCML